MSKWVQHTSGQGKRWKVANEGDETWDCTPSSACRPAIYLPKSEYVEVSAPEVWKDVTTECELTEGMDGVPNSILRDKLNVGYVVKGYRLRKVQHGVWGYAFIVECKEVDVELRP